jgi:plasmid stabilization system protein ParE
VRVRLAASARKELVEAIRYHEQEREGIGRELAEEIDRAVRLIAERPMIGSEIGEGERKFTVDRFSYNVIYRIEEKTVFVLAIAHHRRKAELLAHAH